MRRAELLLIALITGGFAPAHADELDSLMQRLAARTHGHVTFVEKKYLASLDRPLQSSGELFYDAPDRLEKRSLSPRQESLVLEHGELHVQIGHRQRTLALADYPDIAPLIDSVRATLAGDRAALERLFKVEFSGSLPQWRLLLTPRDARVARSVRRIRIEGSQQDLHEVEIVQADGDRSVMTLGADESS
jgi:hypothetical protein